MIKNDIEKWEKDSETIGTALERLVELITFLRSEAGCPWDKVQTHESLKKCLIEEAYEVIDAIDKGDKKLLEEEIGDLMLQGVFHSILGTETGDFDMISVLNRVSNKMIYRHPHVFSKDTAETIDKALIKWENMKRQEKNRETYANAMFAIPKELPALMKSYKIQKKAAEVGFDWDDVSGAFEKIKEETQELEEIQNSNQEDRLKEEIGDLLFSVVNVSRFLGIDPEGALNFTSQKFVKRFQYMEESADRAGESLENINLERKNKLWEEAKQMLL